jgi:hypothetical protein
MLVPPSIVSEVSTNADATLTPTARDKLDLRVAKQNVNLCRAHGSGCGHCPLPNPGLRDAAQMALAVLEPRFLRSSFLWWMFAGPHLEVAWR